jgi:hypothetical protein
MTANIFISFASVDRKIATTLCTALEARGFECWISSRNILAGENFQVSIVQAIRRAKILLLVFTANSNNSQEMTKELALASQQKLIVIPLRVEDVAPSDAFAYEFATRQWIDFFADWEAAMDQLSQRISSAVGMPAPATLAAPAVIELAAVTLPEESPIAPVEAAAVEAANWAEPSPDVLEDAAALAEPATASALARLEEIARDAGKFDALPTTARAVESTPEPEPVAAGLAEPEEPKAAPKSMRKLILAGVAAAAVAGVALAAPNLMRQKGAAPAPQLAVAVTQPAPAIEAPPPMAEAPPLVEEVKPVAPKRKAKAASKAAESEIPY